MIQILPASATPSLNTNVEHRTRGCTVFQHTPASAETITAVPDGLPGQLYCLKIITSGTSSYVLTFSTNFKTTGTLTTGTADAKVFQIFFESDGVVLNEVARTAAM